MRVDTCRVIEIHRAAAATAGAVIDVRQWVSVPGSHSGAHAVRTVHTAGLRSVESEGHATAPARLIEDARRAQRHRRWPPLRSAGPEIVDWRGVVTRMKPGSVHGRFHLGPPHERRLIEDVRRIAGTTARLVANELEKLRFGANRLAMRVAGRVPAKNRLAILATHQSRF